MCANCGEESVKYLVNTPVGQRAFCSEVCYCLYVDLPFHSEGYYGLNEFSINIVEELE